MTRFWKIKFFSLCVLLFFVCTVPVCASGSDFALHMLDVGQGLSVLAEADGHYLLYDGGGAGASSFVVSYLKRQGISDLDYIIVSHYDEDHLNGIVGALHVFGCGSVLSPDYIPDTAIYRSYVSAVQENGAPVTHPLPGDTFALGNASVEILGPSSYDNPSENNNCISLCIDYEGFRFLLCGDLEADGEADLVHSGADLSCDLYVVNHHGSASSSTFYFLDRVLPNYAFLSCGADNPYGHPAAETMERLQAMDCDLYRTDRQGTVIAYSNGSSLWFSTDPCTDFSSGDLSAVYALEGQGADGNEASGSADGSQHTDGANENEDAGGTDGSEDAGSAGSITYVCNTNTYKFHYEYCDSVAKMKEKNKKITTESRDSLIAQGYVPCKNCCP